MASIYKLRNEDKLIMISSDLSNIYINAMNIAGIEPHSVLKISSIMEFFSLKVQGTYDILGSGIFIDKVKAV
jgi:hypothetical protein